MYTVNVYRAGWGLRGRLYRVVLADINERRIFRAKRTTWRAARDHADLLVRVAQKNPTDLIKFGS